MDDEVFERLSWADMIVSQGGSAIQAGSYDEWNALVERNVVFDLMLLDLQLGERSGFDVLNRILEKKIVARVMVISGHFNDLSFLERLAGYGVVGKLSKPIKGPTLLREAHVMAKSGRYVCDDHNDSQIMTVEAQTRRMVETLTRELKRLAVDAPDTPEAHRLRRTIAQLDAILGTADTARSNFSWKFLAEQLGLTIGKARDAAVSEVVKSIAKGNCLSLKCKAKRHS